MTINRTVAAVLGAIVLVCGAAGSAQAGIRGILSVYNQSANPYHVFVEGQRIGTIYQGQTFRVPVNDWQGPTTLMAIQAGSQGRVRFVQHVRTCQFARWELHTHWEQLRVHGGPHHGGPHPGHGGLHPGHGGLHPGHGRPHHGGAGAIGHGVGMIVRGSDPHNPHREADLAGGIASIIAGAIGR
ncbi:MAG: hypothetical protein H8E44_17155 [Planctomycetes bacterium]|nr:hypothetical protein [Planctomycetota bacterium]MBL7038108.1 hypothetical protein [Pirellulaceae bacterium]